MSARNLMRRSRIWSWTPKRCGSAEELAGRAEKVKTGWRAQQADEAVPGAQLSRDTDE